MPIVDYQAMYPPSPSMGGPPHQRGESPERGRDGGPPIYGRGGPPPSHSYPQSPWMHGPGGYGHPAHGPPPPYQVHHGGPPPPGPDSSKQQGLPPHAHYAQHYPMPPGAYPPQHQQQGPPGAFRGPPPPMPPYGYGGPPRPGAWGYGPYDQQAQQSQRYGYPPSQQPPSQMHGHHPQQQQQNQQPPLSMQYLKQQQQKQQQQQPQTRSGGGGESSQAVQEKSQSQQRTQLKEDGSSEPRKQEEENIKETVSDSNNFDEKSQIQVSDEVDTERAKAAAAAELTLAEVKPIQTDFHFFVHAMRDKLKIAAEKEVVEVIRSRKKSIDKNNPSFAYLVNSNLNCRLMKAWENLKMEDRSEFMKKEEDDRRRFMEEDEVASRHCFTLTARVRSPSKNKQLLSPKTEDAGLDDVAIKNDDRDENKSKDSRSEEERETTNRAVTENLSKDQNMDVSIEDMAEKESKEVSLKQEQKDGESEEPSPLPSGASKIDTTSSASIDEHKVPTVSPKSNDGTPPKETSKEGDSAVSKNENVVTPPSNKKDGNQTEISEDNQKDPPTEESSENKEGKRTTDDLKEKEESPAKKLCVGEEEGKCESEEI